MAKAENKKQPRLCPCGRPRPYADCCGRYHASDAVPGDAETLMRSRYSAYVLGDEAYLLATWHPETRPQSGFLHTEAGQAPLRWLRLEVRQHHRGEQEARVEFIAHYKSAGRPGHLHETSRFELVDGRWHYRDGELYN